MLIKLFYNWGLLAMCRNGKHWPTTSVLQTKMDVFNKKIDYNTILKMKNQLRRNKTVPNASQKLKTQC